jgi:hypothetical protein
LRQRDLRLAEVRLRRGQRDPVDREVVLDPLQFQVRGLVRVFRALQIRVELLDLAEHLLGLSPFRADRWVTGCYAGRDASRSKGNDEHRRLSLKNPDNGLP